MNNPRDFIGNTPATGRGVVIAIIDSGFAKPDAFVGGWAVAGKPWSDATGHGTSVAYVAHSAAPGAKLLGVRAMRDGSRMLYYDDVCAAIDYVGRWAWAHPTTRVICNISLTGTGWTGIEKHIEALVAAGIPVVVAAGNTGEEEHNIYPSCCQSPIVVGAVDALGKPAPFSTRHADVDICQLGVDVCTGEAAQSGTSFAAPIVAAMCACILEQHPAYTEPQVLSVLLARASPVDFGGFKIPLVRLGTDLTAEVINVPKGKKLCVYDGPGSETVIGYVRTGDIVTLMGRQNKWRKIRYLTDKGVTIIGWANKRYLEEG